MRNYLHDYRGSLIALEQSTEPKTGIARKTFPGVVTKGDFATFDAGYPEPLVSSVVETSNAGSTAKFLELLDKVAVQALIMYKFIHVAFTGNTGIDILLIKDVNILVNISGVTYSMRLGVRGVSMLYYSLPRSKHAVLVIKK